MQKTVARKRQKGAVLIATLMILLLLTVFGISTMDTNILEEKMAGNMRERNIAFQMAEAALRGCEAYLGALGTLPDSSNDGSTSIWEYKAPDLSSTNDLPWWEEWVDANWLDNSPANAVIALGDTVNSTAVGTAVASSMGLSNEPLCVIEKLPPVFDSVQAGQPLGAAKIYLQITARGLSASGKGVVLLQSVYKW